jgi:flavin-dependent dehydrogenase
MLPSANLNLSAVVVAVGVVAVVATGAVIGAQTQFEPATDDGPDADTRVGVDNETENERDDDRGENETVTTVTGTLQQSAGEDYRLAGLAVDVGAEWYTSETVAETDFDGDGTVETVGDEFDGLVGQNVTVTVETDGTEGDLRAVDGQQYREAGPPPWAGGPNGHGPPAHAGPDH